MSGLIAWESKKGMGFLEELMKAMQEWTEQALPQTQGWLQVSMEGQSSEQGSPQGALLSGRVQ